MLRDYQVEICEKVNAAFATHRSVMMQMPTGTGKTVVLASLVKQFLDESLELRDGSLELGENSLELREFSLEKRGFNSNPNSLSPNPDSLGSKLFSLSSNQDSLSSKLKTLSSKLKTLSSNLKTLSSNSCQVLIVAHRIELIEQIGEHLRGYGISYGVIAGGRMSKETEPVMVASIQTLSSKLSTLSSHLSPSLVVIDEAHHALAKTYQMLWTAWPEAKFLGLTATPYRMSGDGFTDLFEVLVDSWSVKQFIADGWLSPYDYYSIRPDSEDQQEIDSLKKRGADGDFQMKELREKLDVQPSIERLYESFEQFAFDKKGIIYAIDIVHAEHIAEYYRQQGVNAVAISSKTPTKERQQLLERFKDSESLELRDASLELRDSSLELRDESLELRDESLEPRDSSLELRDSSLELRDCSLELRDGSLEKGGFNSNPNSQNSNPNSLSSNPNSLSSNLKTLSSNLSTLSSSPNSLSSNLKSLSSNLSTLSSISILVSVDLFSEGFDCPDVEFIQMARPTLSLAKYLQMVGRGLRPCQGKQCCTIIDNVGLYRTFGLPSVDRDWGTYFLGNEELGIRNEELAGGNEQFLWLGSGDLREENDADIVKIISHEGMQSQFTKLSRAGFARRKKGKTWVWIDMMNGVEFDRHPKVINYRGLEMSTADGDTFFPRISSKWIDAKHGISRKALETQVGEGIGWMKLYISLAIPDKVLQLQAVKPNLARIYKDEQGRVYLQQDPDHAPVSEEEAGGRKEFMTLCDKQQQAWEEMKKRIRKRSLKYDTQKSWWHLPEGSIKEPCEGKHGPHIYHIIYKENGENKEFWVDDASGFTYRHRPVLRKRGFVEMLCDGDVVYLLNIHEERFMPYRNWEIRADDRICVIGNKLYFCEGKDASSYRIKKRSDDFRLFVVEERTPNRNPNTIAFDEFMIINEGGKILEIKKL